MGVSDMAVYNAVYPADTPVLVDMGCQGFGTSDLQSVCHFFLEGKNGG